jgi:hypothetical protein
MKISKKNILLFIFLSFLGLKSYGQPEKKDFNAKSSIATVGFLQGGGSLVGIDFEQLIYNKIGVSVGFGFLAYGASFHYHIKPKINSSSIAFNYWHQGIGTNYVQSLIGPSYVFRLKKILSFQIGVGSLIDKGPNYKNAFGTQKQDILLIYSIGLYF